MKKFFRYAIICFIVIGVSVSNLFSQTQQLVRIHFRDKNEAISLYQYDLDFALHYLTKYADIVASDEDIQFLRDRGYQFEVRDEDMSKTFKKNVMTTSDMGAYHTYQEMYDEMVQINTDFPQITKLTSIGRSIEGRNIWAMKVSDNPQQEEADEPDLLYMANMHAREVATPEIILHFLNYLVNNYGADAEVTDLVNNREFWLVPTQNPDGHVYVESVNSNWRKNRRNNGDGTYGVDLNRNYGYKWGYNDNGSSPNTWSETYRGSAPFSEPESQVIRQLCISHNFVASLSYHSYGRMWLFPWGYIAQNTPHHAIFNEIGKNCAAYNGYVYGNAANGTIYLTNGDTDDYFYGEQTEKNMTFGFTPEVGDAFWPPESQIPILCEENLQPNLYVARIADFLEENPYRLMGPATPALDPLADDYDGNYTITWTIVDDPNNPAACYQLDELSGFAVTSDSANHGDDRWELDGFVTTAARNHTPALSYYSNMGNGLNNAMTARFPITVENNTDLTFWTWYDIEDNWDYAYVELSTDGGITYNSIPGSITTNNNPNDANAGNGITGYSGGWVLATFDLSSYVGQMVCLNIRYATDASVMGEGIYIDDIYPVTDFDQVITLNDSIVGTSYQIQGQTSGIYYYRVRAEDAEQQLGGWSDLEDITVENQSSCQLGDVNMDSDITPADALCAFLIYMNNGTPPPGECSNGCALEVADVNCAKNGITPGDALYIFLAYFAGDVPPLNCDPTSVTDETTFSKNLCLSIVQKESGTPENMLFGLVLNNAAGLKSFGVDIGFPDELLEFAEVKPTLLTECWQAFSGKMNDAGVVRIGGFHDEAIENQESVEIAEIKFKIRESASGSGELWQFNLCDDVTNAKIEPCQFEITTTDVRQIKNAAVPDKYSLEQNYPNPFNMETEIVYQLPEAGFVELSIYNSLGQKIRTLVSQHQSAGRYIVDWNGVDDNGGIVSSGVYLYKMKANNFLASSKLILMK